MAIRARAIWLSSAAMLLAAAPAAAQSLDPGASLGANASVGPVGGDAQDAAYTHLLTVDLTARTDAQSHWSLELTGAWSAGTSLTDLSIHDTSGVQGSFAGGEALWLYQAALRYDDDRTSIAVGRVTASDWFGTPDDFPDLVNSAFSSNGGAIALNDPGFSVMPASSWGLAGHRRYGTLRLSGGVFLSNPARFAPDKHGIDLAFDPGDGMMGFGELAIDASAATTVTVGGWADSAPFERFDGSTDRGNAGVYASIEHRIAHGPSLTAMIQLAPRDDRSIFPFFAIASARWHGLVRGRPDDLLLLGAHAGKFSALSGKQGWEAAIEADYQFRVSKALSVQPDLQLILNPGDTGGAALVTGLQLNVEI